MMYKKNVVACIKVGGQILRESSDRVVLPFGSEYSILLKNLDSVRVQAKVSIDSQDATDGTWLVLEPNSSLELERFIRNGNLNRGNRFKFIERTKPIEAARGVTVDDGLVRIEYKKEFVAPTVTTNIVRTKYIYDYDYYWDHRYKPYWPYIPYWTCNTTVSNASSGTQVNLCSAAVNAFADMGITVPGSESQQQFTHAQNFQTESQSEVIVLHLVGTNQKSEPVKKAVTVSTKPKCITCHKVNKGNSKFCSQCGTALEII